MKLNVEVISYIWCMKNLIWILILLPIFSYSQTGKINIRDGESCSYNIHYGFFSGGYAKYSVDKKDKEITVVLEGKTNSIIDVFFKIRDRYETIVNTSSRLPRYFKRDIIEGSDEIHQEYFFNQETNKVNTHKGSYDCVKKSQDMLSSFIYGRSLSSKKLKSKEPFYINMFLDEENYMMEVKYLATEVINSKIGKIRCIKLQPKVQIGRVFSNEDDLIIWVSDDKNHILIKLEMGILVGSLEVDIQTAKNIKYPLSITD